MAEILHDPTWLLTDWTTTPATLLVVKGQDGGYYVKNGRTGSIEFVEDDPSRAERAIQAAIDAAPPGGLIALTTGEFKISGTISLNKNGMEKMLSAKRPRALTPTISLSGIAIFGR